MEQWLNNNIGTEAAQYPLWVRLIVIGFIIIIAYLIDLIFKHAIIPMAHRITTHTDTHWDDVVLSPKVISSFSSILPPIVLCAALPIVVRGELEVIITKLTLIYIIFNVCRFISSLMSAIFMGITFGGNAKASSLRGILQTFQIIAWIIGFILMISIVLDRSPLYLITGLGAAATVLMLVFQDSIKGLVAGVQLTLNDMVRVGDWIAMPSRNVDGVVREITLSTVKVQNWDNTIMTIQPYAMLTDTFQNWRGMSESAGRRIARAINVDMHSIQFLDASQVAEFQAKGLLPATAKPNESTNLEAFRTALTQHLRRMPEINDEMTLMVRQLAATPEGIPLQVYAFSRTKVWEEYEGIQARIVEYMLCLMPQFGLAPYQRSSDKRNKV